MYILGLGASAGGLKALLEFFNNVPEDSGCAYVAVQHLSPDFKSMMGELLSNSTNMNILYVEEGMKVEENNIYLIPPKHFIFVKDGVFHLEDRTAKAVLHAPIDLFFKSMAENYKDKSIADETSYVA